MNLENYTKNKHVYVNKSILFYWEAHNNSSSSKQAIYTSTKQYHEQQLNPSAIYFQIQREHSFISPKNSFRRELRNSKVRVNFELKNKFQSLYCLYEPATENEFSPLPEDTDFCRNQSVISKSGRCPQLVVNNHPEKQTVFTNKESCPREGIVCSDYSNRKKSN